MALDQRLTANIALFYGAYDDFVGTLSDLDDRVVDRSGQTFNNTPTWQSFLSVQDSMPIEPGSTGAPWWNGWIMPRIEWAYPDRYRVLGPEVQATVQPGYHLIHARLSYDFMHDRGQVAL